MQMYSITPMTTMALTWRNCRVQKLQDQGDQIRFVRVAFRGHYGANFCMKPVKQFLTRLYIFIYATMKTSRYLDWSDSRTGFEEVARSPAALAKTNLALLAPLHPACDKRVSMVSVLGGWGLSSGSKSRRQTKWELAIAEDFNHGNTIPNAL